MKITNEEVTSKQHGLKAESNNEILNSLVKETITLNGQLGQIFKNRIDELKPVIEVLRKNNYYFKYPDNECEGMSTRGPIIDYNNNHYFVYSIDEDSVYKVNNFNTDSSEKIHFSNFIKQWDFEKAMNGLNYVLELQERFAEIHKKNQIDMRALIDKYS
ncbi:hypothetical protein SAMN05421670_0813 [Psychrobacillus psychrotolerans]|uniref:Uncharacterized protein n=1 Tax=Psychrobacillus psychrotolerans TaxID=126156 RepID=A0A1I5VH47_9BACI|nr:hypothetical protein [Psychrobacillus psychrotolerans]SFQ06783.1 hypothetical protein SAMN05421670_0813 [Psychrobacillus psychrotolerans]